MKNTTIFILLLAYGTAQAMQPEHPGVQAEVTQECINNMNIIKERLKILNQQSHISHSDQQALQKLRNDYPVAIFASEYSLSEVNTPILTQASRRALNQKYRRAMTAYNKALVNFNYKLIKMNHVKPLFTLDEQRILKYMGILVVSGVTMLAGNYYLYR